MTDDPIVDEVRQIRDKLAQRFNYDVHAIFSDLMTRQREDDPAHPLVGDARAYVDAMNESEIPVVKENPPRAD